MKLHQFLCQKEDAPWIERLIAALSPTMLPKGWVLHPSERIVKDNFNRSAKNGLVRAKETK